MGARDVSDTCVAMSNVAVFGGNGESPSIRAGSAKFVASYVHSFGVAAWVTRQSAPAVATAPDIRPREMCEAKSDGASEPAPGPSSCSVRGGVSSGRPDARKGAVWVNGKSTGTSSGIGERMVFWGVVRRTGVSTLDGIVSGGRGGSSAGGGGAIWGRMWLSGHKIRTYFRSRLALTT